MEGNNTDLANNFNVYVSTAGTKLLQDLGDVPFSTEINYCEKFMVVALVDENEILGIVRSLKRMLRLPNHRTYEPHPKVVLKDHSQKNL